MEKVRKGLVDVIEGLIEDASSKIEGQPLMFVASKYLNEIETYMKDAVKYGVGKKDVERIDKKYKGLLNKIGENQI